MHFVLFYHSLVSDWNHGNAHFLRGIVTELIARGHRVDVYEPRAGWSLTNLLKDQGTRPLEEFRRLYPHLRSRFHDGGTDLDGLIEGADVVLVHEWNESELVRRIGQHRRQTGGYRLFFHDTHHRSVTDPQSIADYDLREYDGVLAFGRVVRDLYLDKGWAARAWTWHEAADTRLFRPLRADHRRDPARRPIRDLIWVGNWGDEERTEELHEFLLRPVRQLGLRASVYGVRYPREGVRALRDAGIAYGGWLPNFRVPDEFARHHATVHVPRRPYRERLPGVPTIRMFEALACGIPLVSAAWDDFEGLFDAGEDFLVAHNGRQMQRQLRDILNDPALARHLAEHGRQAIERKHTCAHRVDELLEICSRLGCGNVRPPAVGGYVDA